MHLARRALAGGQCATGFGSNRSTLQAIGGIGRHSSGWCKTLAASELRGIKLFDPVYRQRPETSGTVHRERYGCVSAHEPRLAIPLLMRYFKYASISR